MKKIYKRTCRKMSAETKSKISRKLKGRVLTAEHRRKISEGLRKAWETIPFEK